MKKGLMNVMIANIVCLVINILTNLLVPKFVSVDSYSMIKTYALYLTFAGLFSAGYNDGMYLQYGGQEISAINKKELADNFVNYFFLMCIMLILVLFCGILLNNFVIIAFSFGMFSYNILGYLKSLYQATGEFKAYGKALNIEKVIVFIFTVGLIFLCQTDNYKLYISIQVVVGVFVSIYLFAKLEGQLHFLKLGHFKTEEYKKNISSGFILMIGNFSNSVFTGLDRLFIKIIATNVDFAMYSFAVSMESVINVFISPITVAMYNYFCKKPAIANIKRIKKLSLIWSFLIIAAAFPAKFILENYLQNYIMANDVIFILFAAQVFYVVVKGIYVNLYKAEKRQNLYLKQMIVMIIIGVVLNALFYSMFRNINYVALATLLTSAIWMYTCELINSELRFGWRENLAIFILILVYLFCGYNMESIIGAIIYCTSVWIICFVLMPDSVRYILDHIKHYFVSASKDSV